VGSIWFDRGTLADHLHEVIGYKAGVVTTIAHMCDLLLGTDFPDFIGESERECVRLRSEDYDELYYSLLHKVGATAECYEPFRDLFALTRRLQELGGGSFASDMLELSRSGMDSAQEAALSIGAELLDPTPVIMAAHQRYGQAGLDGIMAIIEFRDRAITHSPHHLGRFETWTNLQPLQDLFTHSGVAPMHGRFLDQRLIDYLSVNGEQLGDIHWRRFEKLTAEYFQRLGFIVELGTGGNDDGVDIRVWRDGADPSLAPQYLIQCKRQQAKIDKITVKGLYADVSEAGADMGLLVTSSEFSPGARDTVAARGYPIQEINGDRVREWLRALRTPGSGIIRT
jgi:restriction system protein